jgi:hypothetical protein
LQASCLRGMEFALAIVAILFTVHAEASSDAHDMP